MDIAELGLSIRSDGVVVATDRLKDFERQSGRTEKAGVLLTKVFAVLSAAFGVSKLIDYTNRWTDLSSRVEIATGSIGQGAATMQRLSEMARRTYSSLDLTAESFLLNATAMREMGATTGQTLDYVEAINNALVVSGAKGDRAASVMGALSKAMALGKLSGDNLNTVISTGGRVAEALAQSMGVTTLELRALGAAGKITSKDIIGITSQLELLREEADSMPATIGDAFTLLGNAILTMVGQFDQARGASSLVAEAIIWLSDAMNNGTISVERMLAMATAFALFMAGSWVAGVVAAAGAVGTLSAALGLLRVALIRTGIGALVVIAGELIYQLWNVVDGADSVGDAFGRMQKSGVQTWERIVAAAQWFESTMNAISDRVVAYLSSKWLDLLRTIINSISALNGAMGGMGVSISLNGLVDAAVDTAARVDAYSASAEGHAAAAAGHWSKIFEDKSTTSDVGTMPSFGAVQGTLGGPGTITTPSGGTSGAAAKAAKDYDDIIRKSQEFIRSQELEAQAIGMTEEAANRLRYEQEMLNDAANDNISLTAAQREQIGGLAIAMAAAEAATKKAKDTFDFMKDAVGGFLTDFRQAIGEGQSFWEAFGNAANRVLDKIISKIEDQLLESLFSFGGSGGASGGGILSAIGSLFGFADGGYTGNVPANRVAGVVHGGEYVFSAAATNRIGVANLEAMHSSAKGYAGGGYVAAAPAMPAASNQNRPINFQTNIINNAGVEVVERSSDDGQGGVRQEIVLNRAVANAIGKPGPAQRAVRQTGRLVTR